MTETLHTPRPSELVEHFLAEAISNSPQPLKDLALFLSSALSEDDWKTADRLLLALALRNRTSEPGAGEAVSAEEYHRRGVNLIGMTEWAGAHLCRAEKAEARLPEVMAAVKSAHDDLIELNISNYTHDDVSEANNATVEAILTLKNVLEPEPAPTPATADKLRIAVEALEPFAKYYRLNDCQDMHGNECLEVPVYDLLKACTALAALNEGGE